MQIASGECLCRRIVSLKNFVRALSASAAQCIISGALPTWRSLGSPGGGRRNIPVAFPTCRTEWLAKPTRMKSAVAGFGPGGGPIAYPVFYSYAYPEPAGFASVLVKPSAAFYSTDLREFILPYDVVRKAESPDETLLDFLQTTYEAAANLANWDRNFLERRT